MHSRSYTKSSINNNIIISRKTLYIAKQKSYYRLSNLREIDKLY